MLTFKELIMKTDFTKVWEKLIIHYPDMIDRFDKFNAFYINLKVNSCLPNSTNMYIYIKAFQEIDGEDTLINKFDENDVTVYFDVCGKDDECSCYSIASSKFRKWLGYFVDENSLYSMSNESFIAHCLWEMTFYYGFDDSKA